MNEFVGKPSKEHLKAIEEFRKARKKAVKKEQPYKLELEENIPQTSKNLKEFETLLEKQKDLNTSFKKYLPKSRKDIHIDLKKFQKPIAITGLGDLHLGASGLDTEQLVKDIRTITTTKGMFAVGMGDWLQNFIQQSKFNAGWGDLRVSHQWVLIELIVKSLAKTLILMNPGNHDLWTQELTDADKMAEIAKKSDICYNNDESPSSITIDYGNIQYTGAFRHKPKGGSQINPMLGVKKIWDLIPYDFCMTGHCHTFGIEYFERHAQTRVALACGSYKIDDRFGKKCGFPSAMAVMPTVILMPDRKEILAFENIDTAAEVLKSLREVF